MIQRSLLRHVQAIKHLSHSYAPRTTPIIQSATQRLPAFSSPSRPSSQRYYSEAAEPATKSSSEPPSTSSAPSDAKEQEDPIKKELESKNREIIDLKVGLRPCTLVAQADFMLPNYRTATYAPSLTFATSKKERSATSNPRAILQSRDSPPISLKALTTLIVP